MDDSLRTAHVTETKTDVQTTTEVQVKTSEVTKVFVLLLLHALAPQLRSSQLGVDRDHRSHFDHRAHFDVRIFSTLIMEIRNADLAVLCSSSFPVTVVHTQTETDTATVTAVHTVVQPTTIVQTVVSTEVIDKTSTVLHTITDTQTKMETQVCPFS